MKKTMYL